MTVASSSGPGVGSLSVQAVTKRFHQLTAVDAVSFELARGEILGLIGPNGSGKSTLINVITGVLPATSGRVFADGLEISGKAPNRIAHAGLARTFQGVRLFSNLSVLENIVVAALSVNIPRRLATQRAHDLLARFDMTAWAESAADSLPHGHERVVEVARALAMEPKFLFLDEPAAGLDESESEALLHRLLAMPAERGLGLLIVDHDMSLIMRLCQRIHVLNYGRTIAEGTPAEIRQNPDVLAAYLGRDGGDVAYA